MSKLKILFCGTAIPEQAEQYFDVFSAAGDMFQNNLIEGLREHYEVSVLSFCANAKYEALDDIKREFDKKQYDYIIKKHFFSSIVEYQKEMFRCLRECDICVSYNVTYAWILLSLMAKIFGKKSVLILADYTPAREEKGIIRKLISIISKFSILQYKRVVLLSRRAQSLIRKKQESVVIEGGIKTSDYAEFSPNYLEPVNEKICILFSGMLSEITGVNLYLDAIEEIEREDIEFIFTGNGPLASKVAEASEKDVRIKYMGFMSRQQYISMLKRAHIFINPRNMEFAQNQNNFPSKFLEYLAVGRLIISTKFPGYELFREYAFFCDSNAKSIRDAVDKICEKITEKPIVEETYVRNREKAEEYEWERIAQRFIEGM